MRFSFVSLRQSLSVFLSRGFMEYRSTTRIKMVFFLRISCAFNASNTVIPHATTVRMSEEDFLRTFEPPISNVSFSEYKTGVLGRRVRRYEIPLCDAIKGRSFAVLTTSHGWTTTEWGIVLNIAISSSHI